MKNTAAISTTSSTDILTKYLESIASTPVVQGGLYAGSTTIGTSLPSDPTMDYESFQRAIESMVAAQKAMHDPAPETLQHMSVQEMMNFVFAEFVCTGRIQNTKSSNLFYIMSEYATEETVNDPFGHSQLGSYLGSSAGFYNHQHAIGSHAHTYRQTFRRFKFMNSEYRQHSKHDNIILNNDKTKYMDLNFVSVRQMKMNDEMHGTVERIHIEFKTYNSFLPLPTSVSTSFSLDYDHGRSSFDPMGWRNEIVRPFRTTVHIRGAEHYVLMLDKKEDYHHVVLKENKAQDEEPLNIEFDYHPNGERWFSDEDKFQLDLLNFTSLLVPVLEVVQNDYGIIFY